MKRHPWLVALLLVIACSGARAEISRDIERARVAAAELGGALKSRLMAAVQEAGITEAIGVCQHEAPELAAALSAKHEVKVTRISARTRNPANRPNDRESIGLARLEAQLAEGADPATLEWAEVSAVAHEETEFRYLKPIMVEPLCLACHGTAIDPAIKEVLAVRYPEDLATGYELGQMRGAFSVTISKPAADALSPQ